MTLETPVDRFAPSSNIDEESCEKLDLAVVVGSKAPVGDWRLQCAAAGLSRRRSGPVPAIDPASPGLARRAAADR
jgi:hypothetical protein